MKSQNTFAYHGTDEWANWMIDLHRKKYVTLESNLQMVYSRIYNELKN